jgi:hypothetical protein
MPYAPTRRALVVGIDQYPLLDPDRQLQGCVHDAQEIARVLRDRFEFPAENVAVLLNGQASRDAILAGLHELLLRSGPGDAVVFHYSGHGSQRREPEGSKNEADGMDEVLIAADSGRGSHPSRDITDDEIYSWLLEMSKITPCVTVIYDCCHSGGGVRIDKTIRKRYLPPDLRTPERLPTPWDPAPKTRSARESSWREGDRCVLLAACGSDQAACEIDESDLPPGTHGSHGAMTWFLLQELQKAPATATYREVFEPAALQVGTKFKGQTPQLEGRRDRVLFGTAQLVPMAYVPVSERTGDRVVLGAGAACGLSLGAVWTVWPAGTRDTADESVRLGRIEITSVRAVSSDARILEESGAGIAVGARAVEEKRGSGADLLEVSVEAPPERGEQVRSAIAASPLLALAQNGHKPAVTVRLLDPRQEAGIGPAPVWAIEDAGGQVVAPLAPVSDDTAGRLVKNLEVRCRYLRALALRNPDSPLAGRVQLEVRRLYLNRWEEVGEGTPLLEGDRISIRIASRHDAPLYINLLDMGLNGTIDLVYPLPGASDALAARGSVEIGVRAGEEIRLYMPEEMPFDPRQKGPASGLEVLKLIVSSRPVDVWPLLQEGVRRGYGDEPEGNLMELLAATFRGRNLRAQAPLGQAPEDWTTVERSFVLRNGI